VSIIPSCIGGWDQEDQSPDKKKKVSKTPSQWKKTGLGGTCQSSQKCGKHKIGGSWCRQDLTLKKTEQKWLKAWLMSACLASMKLAAIPKKKEILLYKLQYIQ
jgi:hypothetical protein